MLPLPTAALPPPIAPTMPSSTNLSSLTRRPASLDPASRPTVSARKKPEVPQEASVTSVPSASLKKVNVHVASPTSMPT